MKSLYILLLQLVILPGLAFAQTYDWQMIGQGLERGVNNICEYRGELIVAGTFRMSGDSLDSLNRVARWDGQKWQPLDKGIGGDGSLETINDMIVFKDELYVTGRFVTTGAGDTVNHIARWDGVSWKSVKSGFWESYIGQYPMKMLIYKDELYIVQSEPSPRDTNIISRGIVRWTGTQWRDVGNGVVNTEPINATHVESMNLIENRIILCEYFNYFGTPNGPFTYTNKNNGFASWNGVSWDSVPPFPKPPFDCIDLDMMSYQGDIYIAGFWYDKKKVFTARWNGIAWDTSFIPDYNGSRSEQNMSIFNDKLYFGGQFNVILGNDTVNALVSWDGQNWEKVLDFKNSWVGAMYLFNNEIYIGGAFKTIDGQPANNIIKLTLSTSTKTTPHPEIPHRLMPNPARGTARILIGRRTGLNLHEGQLKFYNVRGQAIRLNYVVEENEAGREIEISGLGALPTGLYFYALYGKDGYRILNGKMVVGE